MTFIANQDGVVYQAAWVKRQPESAAKIKDNPDNQWTIVQEQGITDLTADDGGGAH